MELAWDLARRLGDGRFHSGQSLAEEFRVSRSTVWNMLRALKARGLEVQAVRGKGYRLPAPVDWLDSAVISAALAPAIRDRVAIEVLQEAESTNTRLLGSPPPEPGRSLACLAEYQTGGRGRRGRGWLSPPGGGVCLSVAWQFDRPPANLPSLSLAAGLAVREALLASGAEGVMLKWPNDLVVGDAKLGGLLLEIRAEGNGPCHAVVGAGVNYRLPAGLARQVVQTGGLVPVDVVAVCASEPPSRNRVAAAIISAVVARLESVATGGSTDIRDEWRVADALLGRRVIVEIGRRRLAGRAEGIDADGSLRVFTDEGLARVTAGDVSVRPER